MAAPESYEDEMRRLERLTVVIAGSWFVTAPLYD